MTPVALYLYVSRVALFVGSGVLIWMAAFLILCRLLQYEPRQIEPVPRSRRELILFAMLAIGVGVTILVLTVTGGFDYTIVKHMPFWGCIGMLNAVVGLFFIWTSIVELRRAVRLRREQLQQPDDQPQVSGDQ